jgi:hypothetical protein
MIVYQILALISYNTYMTTVKPSKNYEYFVKTDMSEYENQWVAIADNEVVAHGRKADAVYQKAKKKVDPEKISLAKIPKKGLLFM